MILTPSTVVYVVGKRDGSFDTMTLRGYNDALKGGLNPDECVVTTDMDEARQQRLKYEAIAKVVKILDGLDCSACQKMAAIVSDSIVKVV